ncbi:succinate-semialdehyde dehydrogenase [Pseudovirgaria hyperparasitica]|uniref:Succinate-semialdehyde dehydrogenase n=1 Tax=Pseudovirgaria hyperparasitica TaxID=470096 RepID=A0A6A6VWA2_9PEZI|nr:succinate-semialdehyde dehydrogenase [Pseudovirgaria hyperparasitica]KAF2754445.1 succinate-semialdehyde dehydrogenase [Pseudovirgaria hyperparasitica]
MVTTVPSLQDQSLFIGKNYINGQWVDSCGGKTFNVTDPATGLHIGTCPESTVEDAQHAVDAAAAAFPAWRSKSGRERGRVIRRWYELVLENKGDIATLITWENGKARVDAAGEVVFAASFLEWFSEEAARIYGDVVPHSNAQMRAQVIREPVGVCGLITPWNFPIAMAARKLGPALAAGCTVVLKTDGQAPFSGNAIAVLAERAGVPRGVLNVVTALENTPAIGKFMCESDTIRKISFTGSTRVGRILMSQSAHTLKGLSLELGGNAPFIVFNDADLDLAIAGTVASKFKVSGQTCVCANRIYVQDGIYDRYVAKLTEVVSSFKVGHGFDAATSHGPLIHAAAVAKVQEHVDDAVKHGARVAIGGRKMPSLGPNFFEPTILINVDDRMKIASEETFGPVAPIFRFSTEDEVIARANNASVGLASYLFSQDTGTLARVSEALQAGMVAINTGVISDASAPFGGVKHSGLGREGSRYGMEDYMQLKTIITGNVKVVHRAQL